MSPSYQHIPEHLPADSELVWCRPFFYFVEPFIAQYNATAQTFTSLVNSVVYPVYFIQSYKEIGIGEMSIGSTFVIH